MEGGAPLTHVCVINVSARDEWISPGTVLGDATSLNHELVPFEQPGPGQPNLEAETPEDDQREALDQRVAPSVTGDARRGLIDLLMEFRDCFAGPSEELGLCSAAEHVIDTGDARPVKQPSRSSAWKERELIRGQVNEMLNQGVIEKSTSPWASPVVMVKKKDGSWRFCVYYRGLNRLTVPDVYPLPRIEETLSRLEGATCFSIMDLQAGYWQVPIRPSDRPKTAFVTADGLFQFKVMPFGLCSAPGTFQRMMDLVLAGLRWSACLVYLDDIIVYSSSLQEHMDRLRKVLTCLRSANLKLKLSKCLFARPELQALGHVISAKGIGPDTEKVAAVVDFPEPSPSKTPSGNVKLIRSFVGCVHTIVGLSRGLLT